MSELSFIHWLRQRTMKDPRVLVGPGDDTAVIHWPANDNLLITTDMLLEGSCFLLNEAGPRLVGRKALAVNLSDIAAMAGRPVAAVVSVGLPRQGGTKLAEELYLGIEELAREFNTPIVGGDTNSWNGPLVINVTLIGETTGRGPVRRCGAKPGDWLFVTGPLGGSIRGKHLTFKPRIQEAIALHALVQLNAMIDISDGLSTDLHHVCEESNCGAVIREADIPISDAAKQMNDGCTPLDHALADGEDFELLFAVSEKDGRELLRTQPLQPHGVTLSRIGDCLDTGIWLEKMKGNRVRLPPTGYVHELSEQL